MASALSPWFRGRVLSLASCRSRATTPLLPSRCLHERLDHRQLQRLIHGVARSVAQPHGPRRSGGRYFFLALLRLAVIFRSDGISVIPWFRGRVLSLARCRSRDSPSTFSMSS